MLGAVIGFHFRDNMVDDNMRYITDFTAVNIFVMILAVKTC